MYQDYANGGLRMINFKLFVKTQRIMWLKRLLYGEKDTGWKMYFDYCFRSVGGRFLFLCDYESSKLKLTAPPFYIEMVKAWQDMDKFRFTENEGVNPILFNNRNICFRGKMIFDKDLYEAGICKVHDLLDNGQMKPMTHFKSLGVKRNSLSQIMDIFYVIPPRWRSTTLLKFQQVDLINFNIILNIFGQRINFQGIKSRKIYEVFVKDLQLSYNLQIKDGHNDFDFTDKEKSELFVRLRSTTLVRKQREFQFMLLHRAVYTKEQLLRFGFVADNLCSFCQQGTETYSHLFLQCDKIKEIWEFIIEQYKLVELRNKEWQDIFVGLSGTSNRIKCVNTLIILVKYTIFKSRSEGVLPSRVKIRKLISDFIEEEKKLAIKAGKLEKHFKKWEHLN